jgi:transcriptional regulator with XRE-family HTH domain/KaiC/GvpD/RAD55 family RecA-like ATPase
MQGKRISSGVRALDRLLGGLRVGDNVVWHMDSAVFLEAFLGGLLKVATRRGEGAVFVTVNSPPKTILGRLKSVVDHPNVTVIDGFTWGKGEGAELFTDCYEELYANCKCRVVPVPEPEKVEAFLRVLNEIEEQMPPGTRYIFDSLTGMVHLWGTEEPVLGFFTRQCPRLYELQTVAYWILERGAHTNRFRAEINHITQVALELVIKEGNPVLKVLKAQGRESSSTLRPKNLVFTGKGVQLLDQNGKGGLEFLIGPRLRSIRQRRGISQVELAKSIGVSPSTISQVEAQQIILSLPVLVRAARALGVSVDELVGGAMAESHSPIIARDQYQAVNLGRAIEGLVSVLKITPPTAGPGGFEAYEVTIQPQARLGGHFFNQKGAELGYLMEGELLVEFRERKFLMERGDSIRLLEELPRGWENPKETPARLIWIMGK